MEETNYKVIENLPIPICLGNEYSNERVKVIDIENQVLELKTKASETGTVISPPQIVPFSTLKHRPMHHCLKLFP